LKLLSVCETSELKPVEVAFVQHAFGSSSRHTTMLASQNRLLSGSRMASFKQQQPFVAAGRSRVQPTIVAKAKLAPLVDAFKADQLRTDLPPVRSRVVIHR
jgi:hypothetical protein